MQLAFLNVLGVLVLGAGVADGALAEVSGDLGDWEVSSDQVVAAAGVTCNSITFNASAKISGGPITLGSGGITVASGVKGAVIESVIDGSADFTVQGPGMANSEISFKGANTFTGNMTVRGVLLHAYTDQAFGSTSGSTTIYAYTTVDSVDLAGQIKFHGIDTSEPIRHYNRADNKNEYGMAFFFDANTTNILRGTVNGQIGRMNFNAGENAYTVISNSWTGIGNTDNTTRPVSSVFEVFAPMSWSRFFFIGTWHFHSPISGSSSGGYGVEVRHEVVMMATNVFASSATTGYDMKMWGSGTWDLNGYDQRLDQFHEYYSTEGTKSMRAGNVKFTITSAKPAVLYYDNSPLSQDYAGKFTGQAGLTVQGNKTLTLTGASTSVGDLVVSNTVGSGTANLTFSATGSWAGTNITVASGSQLTLATADNLQDYVKVQVGATGKCNLTGTFQVKALATNGVWVADNSYGSSQSAANVKDDDHFSGTGMFVVSGEKAEESVWVGGTEGDLLTTAANWKSGKTPDFSTGLAKITFAESGTRTVVPETTERLGTVTLSVPDESPRFGFEPLGEASKVSFAGLTCDTVDLATTRQYTNDVPTLIECAQTWSLPSSYTHFYQRAPLSSSAAIEWVKTGDGRLHLMSDAGDLTGTFRLKGRVDLHNPKALGKMKIIADIDDSYAGLAALVLYGGVISNDVVAAGGNDGGLQRFYYRENTTTEYAGLVDYDSHYDRSYYGSGSKVIFSGGFKNCASWRSPFRYLVFTNKACNICAFNDNGYGAKVEIWTTGNTFGFYSKDESLYFGKGGVRVETHAPYAINTNLYDNSGTIYLLPFVTATYDMTYDLCGYPQQFGHLEESSKMTANQNWTVTSANPAQMKVYQDQDKTLAHLKVTGAAGLTLNGPNALTLTGRTCTTTGALEVEDGTLTLGADESFPNVRTVRVSGGTLALTSAGQLDRRVNLYVSGSGKISIPDGVTLEVRRLYVNGVSQKMGDYTEGVVTGGGKVHVPGGAAIILR